MHSNGANRQAGKVIALILLACASPVWGSGDVQSRIVGGQEAQPGAWPFMGVLAFKGGDAYQDSFCGAVLVNEVWALTAAHCVAGISSASALEFIVGIHDLQDEANEPNSERHALSQIIMHPGYDPDLPALEQDYDSDLALLRLSMASSIAPVRLADAATMAELQTGDSLTTVGWGATSSNGSGFPNRLQQVSLPLVDQDACNNVYAGEITGNMVCAGFQEGGKDSCAGDSGGPLLVFNDGEWQQLGITSFGAGCAQPDAYGVYTRVSKFHAYMRSLFGFAAVQSDLAFGAVGLERQAELRLTLRNYAAFNSVSIGTAQISGPEAGEFSILTDGCSNKVLAAGSSCSMNLQHNAIGNVGQRSAAIQFALATGVRTAALLSAEVLPEVDLGNDLDATGVKWYSSAEAGWFTASDVDATGGTAARSGLIGNDESTLLLAYIQGPATLNYRYRTSTENPDFLRVKVDGVQVFGASGVKPYLNSQPLELNAGCHRVTWTYEKDIAQIDGEDAVFIDQFAVTGSSNPDCGDAVDSPAEPPPAAAPEPEPEPEPAPAAAPEAEPEPAVAPVSQPAAQPSTSGGSAAAADDSGGAGAPNPFGLLGLLLIALRRRFAW